MNVTIPGNTCNLVSCIEMDESGPSNWNARNNVVQDDEDERNEEFLGVALLLYAAMTLELR